MRLVCIVTSGKGKHREIIARFFAYEDLRSGGSRLNRNGKSTMKVMRNAFPKWATSGEVQGQKHSAASYPNNSNSAL